MRLSPTSLNRRNDCAVVISQLELELEGAMVASIADHVTLTIRNPIDPRIRSRFNPRCPADRVERSSLSRYSKCLQEEIF